MRSLRSLSCPARQRPAHLVTKCQLLLQRPKAMAVEAAVSSSTAQVVHYASNIRLSSLLALQLMVLAVHGAHTKQAMECPIDAMHGQDRNQPVVCACMLAYMCLYQPAVCSCNASHSNKMNMQVMTAYVPVCHMLSNLQAYDDLCAKLRELDALSGINGLLSWDEFVSCTCSEQMTTWHLDVPLSPAA